MPEYDLPRMPPEKPSLEESALTMISPELLSLVTPRVIMSMKRFAAVFCFFIIVAMV